MALEIEHKFLLASESWRQLVDHTVDYRQGYLSSSAKTSIRVRTTNTKAWLNIKSATIGNQRHEYEYQIPLEDANEILDRLSQRPLIEKTRHFVIDGKFTWEIDEFKHENQGLIVAEIELSSPDEIFNLPDWIGKEVTQDMRYYNNNLIFHPYSEWN